MHIGTNKTGTSAIQRFCNSNRDLLLNSGLLYPATGCQGDAHYGISQVLGFGQGQLTVSDKELSGLSNNLSKELKESGADSCVVSSENFVLPKALDPVRNLFSGFDCRVIVYLRRHDHWWESAYAEAVKLKVNPPWKRGVKQFVGFYAQKHSSYGDYRFLVDRWAEAFGADKLIVRPYEPDQNPGGVVADFFRTLNYPDLAEHAATQSERVNTALSPGALFMLDVLQRAQMDNSVRAELIKKAKVDAWPAAEYPLFDPQFRIRLIDRNRGDYEYIAKKYLQRPDGVLFTEPEPLSNEPWEPPAVPNVVEVAARLVKYCKEE